MNLRKTIKKWRAQPSPNRLNARRAVLNSQFSRNRLRGCSKLFGGKRFGDDIFSSYCGNWYKKTNFFSGQSGLRFTRSFSGQRSISVFLKDPSHPRFGGKKRGNYVLLQFGGK